MSKPATMQSLEIAPSSSRQEAIDAAVELHERAIALHDEGDYVGAEISCHAATVYFEAAGDNDSADLAHALIERAQLLQRLDRLAPAAACIERAREILAPLALGATHDEAGSELIRLIVRAELTLASQLRALADLTGAEQACRHAMQWVQARFSNCDPAAWVPVLAELGVVYKMQGRLVRAEAVYRRAYGLLAQVGEHESDDGASLLHNLGGLAHARGDHEAGEPLARRALELRQHLLGPEHPIVAADRAAWAALLHGLGRLDAAEQAYRGALDVFEAHLGPTSLEVASALTGLAGVHRDRGLHQEAEDANRRALAIREALLGPNHPDVALTLNDLGQLITERQPAEALAIALRALAIFESRLGSSHPHTRTAAANVVRLRH